MQGQPRRVSHAKPAMQRQPRSASGLAEQRVGTFRQFRHFADVLGRIGEIRSVDHLFPRGLNQQLPGQVFGAQCAPCVRRDQFEHRRRIADLGMSHDPFDEASGVLPAGGDQGSQQEGFISNHP